MKDMLLSILTVIIFGQIPLLVFVLALSYLSAHGTGKMFTPESHKQAREYVFWFAFMDVAVGGVFLTMAAINDFFSLIGG